ncbi:MAG: hypothetical protein RL033_4150 [Pseudomonadota bacterium]
MLRCARRLRGPLLAAALLGEPLGAHAQHAPTSITGAYSAYEQEAIRQAEAALGASVAENPEGKTIESIDVLVLDPIETRDPLPSVLNALHVSTRRHVIEQELLLARGSAYSRLLAEESARKLRLLPQLSVVIGVPFAGSAPDRVRWVISPQDVWSLRLGFSTEFGNTGSGYLWIEPKESNLLGTHREALLRLSADPGSYGVGAGYRLPRLGGMPLSLTADAGILLSEQLSPEGSYGELVALHPLRSNEAHWAWFSELHWRRELARTFEANALRVWQSPQQPEVTIPYVWHSQEFSAQAGLVLSLGWAIKHDFTISAGAARERYWLPEAPALDPQALREFSISELPQDHEGAGPTFEWRSYTSDFLRTHDLETLGLQEDYRLGHDLILGFAPLWGRVAGQAGPGARLRQFFAVHAAAQQTFLIGDGLARLSADWKADVVGGRAQDSTLLARAAIVTPRLGIGRLVHSTYYVERFANGRRRTTYLGGDNRLRGVGNNSLSGSSVLAMNLEYRTPALELAKLQLGAVAFLDTGASFDRQEAQLQHSLGFGLRLVVPQLSRAVFRLDFAFPLERESAPAGARSAAFGWQFGTGQAFDLSTLVGVSTSLAP